MNELGPDARALLDAARDAHDIDPATRARLRSDMLRRIGAGAVVAGTVAAATKTSVAPATSTFASTFAAKLITIAALATAGGYVAARYMTKPAPAPVVVAPVAVATPVAPAATTTAQEAPKPPAMAVIEEPAPAAQPIVKPTVVASKPKAAAAAPAASTLEDELRALREAHLALREGRPSDALSIVDGMKGNSLGPERAATRAIALCSLGRADAQASAEKFLSAYPSSPLAPRVRAACSIP